MKAAIAASTALLVMAVAGLITLAVEHLTGGNTVHALTGAQATSVLIVMAIAGLIIWAMRALDLI